MVFNWHGSRVSWLLLAVILSACSVSVERDGAPSRDIDVDSIPDAVPKREKLSRSGNPDSYIVNGKRYYTLKSSSSFVQRGVASWYGKKFHGRATSSGEIYDMYGMTAAHTQLPLPTYVEVENLRNGRRVTVKVNDRGPFHANRIIDLSYVAAKKLNMINSGTAFVEVRAIDTTRRRPVVAARTESGASPKSAALYIQIGAFRDRNNAEALRVRLQSYLRAGIVVRQPTDSGSRLYRVQIGPIINVPLADQLVAELTKIGINDHYFVVN